ncbi:MAG: hypothetical protein WD358_01915 [Nitriliruptoraceae bacterium]
MSSVRARRPAKWWSSPLAAVFALLVIVVAACGAQPAAIPFPEDVAEEAIAEICELLAEGVLPEGMDQDTYDQLIAGYRPLCEQLGILLPPGSTPSMPGDPGAGAGARPDADPDGDDSSRNGVLGDDADWVDADPFDDEVRRRAVEAGPQCDAAALDLSMSEVAKAPAIGPMGSPPFDAELAKEQHRAPGFCLAEPYRSQWFLIADAYEPLWDFMATYAAASNQDFEAMVALGEQAAELESDLARLQSDEIQDAMASTEEFFAEVRASGEWDDYETASPWGRWWDSDEFRNFWSQAQQAAAMGGAVIPDLPEVP